jgi:hypothetical protein
MANAPVGVTYVNTPSLIKGQLGFPLKPKLPSGATAGGTPPPNGPIFFAQKNVTTHAKFVSYFNHEPRFEQGVGGTAEGAREPETAYAAWLWPVSLASNPAGPLRKTNSPN